MKWDSKLINFNHSNLSVIKLNFRIIQLFLDGHLTGEIFITKLSCSQNIYYEKPRGIKLEIISEILFINFVYMCPQTGQQVVEDVMKIRWEIVVNLLFAMFCCLIVIALMRWVAKPLVWLSILGVLALLGFGK